MEVELLLHCHIMPAVMPTVDPLRGQWKWSLGCPNQAFRHMFKSKYAYLEHNSLRAVALSLSQYHWQAAFLSTPRKLQSSCSRDAVPHDADRTPVCLTMLPYASYTFSHSAWRPSPILSSAVSVVHIEAFVSASVDPRVDATAGTRDSLAQPHTQLQRLRSHNDARCGYTAYVAARLSLHQLSHHRLPKSQRQLHVSCHVSRLCQPDSAPAHVYSYSCCAHAMTPYMDVQYVAARLSLYHLSFNGRPQSRRQLHASMLHQQRTLSLIREFSSCTCMHICAQLQLRHSFMQ